MRCHEFPILPVSSSHPRLGFVNQELMHGIVDQVTRLLGLTPQHVLLGSRIHLDTPVAVAGERPWRVQHIEETTEWPDSGTQHDANRFDADSGAYCW